MNHDQVKGTVNDAAGRAKRQVGEWTGNDKAQVEGTMQQAKGKAQKAFGDVKEAAHNAKNDLDRKMRPVGKAYKELVGQWRNILPTETVCLHSLEPDEVETPDEELLTWGGE